MNKTKIDWANSTWNIVTGCLHGCSYCYARGITKRFGGGYCFECEQAKDEDGKGLIDEDGLPIFAKLGAYPYEETGACHVLEYPANENDAYTVPEHCEKWDGRKPKAYPYPFYFDPTFHKYRLREYEKKKGRNVFVCSMGDLFGEWVPLEWLQEVFKACENAPQHNYLFLTKNPERYTQLDAAGELPAGNNMWYGTTATTPAALFPYNGSRKYNLFLSIEPLLADFGEGSAEALKDIGWVIIGAETGNRKEKVVPKREWVENIVRQCRQYEIPVFMKSSLEAIWGSPLLQEYPQQLQKKG